MSTTALVQRNVLIEFGDYAGIFTSIVFGVTSE